MHFTSRGGTLHVQRGYYSPREGVLFTSRGGALHIERRCTSRQEGVYFTSRGGTLHVERACTSRREGVLFTSRGGAFHVERGGRFKSSGGVAACTCNITNVGVVEGVAFVAVKITLNEFLGNKNLEKSGYRFENFFNI